MMIHRVAVIILIAFSNASWVIILDGLVPRRSNSNTFFPASLANFTKRELLAGMVALPGKAIPKASANEETVLAVPINGQAPGP